MGACGDYDIHRHLWEDDREVLAWSLLLDHTRVTAGGRVVLKARQMLKQEDRLKYPPEKQAVARIQLLSRKLSVQSINRRRALEERGSLAEVPTPMYSVAKGVGARQHLGR